MMPWAPVRSGMGLQEIGAKIGFNEPSGRRRLIVVVAAILLCVFGIAAVMAWTSVSASMANDVTPGEGPPAARVGAETQFGAGSGGVEMRFRARCEHCGVVLSVREAERSGTESGSVAAGGVKRVGKSEPGEQPIKYHEVTVGMQDGSRRVFRQEDRVRWRKGERLLLIGGTSHASN